MKLIKQLSKEHEIACHGKHNFNFSKSNNEEILNSLKKSKKLLENGINKKIIGFRCPKMFNISSQLLKKATFIYDASINPTYVFKRYNNFKYSRKIFLEKGIIRIPTSVSPLIRFPLTWYAFTNLGLFYSKLITKWIYLKNDYINIYFHPWEFVNLNKYNISFIFKNNTGNKIYQILDEYINWLINKKVKFITLDKLIKLKNIK